MLQFEQSRGGMSHPRVLILALDGATFDLIAPWVQQGRLPNLADLLARGVYGVLRSTVPPITPCAWTSFSTAQNPGRHGIFDFQQFVPGTYSLAPTNGAMRKSPTLWEYLNEIGVTVGLYNLPWMYPPPKLNGYCICGFDAPDINAKSAFPPELAQELRAAVPTISLAAEFLKMRNGAYDLEALRRQVRTNVEAARFLLTRYPVDVCVLTFMMLDQAAHFFYYPEASQRSCGAVSDVLLAVHEWVDEGLGELLHLVPSDCLIVGVSDHGVVPTALRVNIARALADSGLLVFRNSAKPGDRSAPGGGDGRSATDPTRSSLRSFKRMLSRFVPQSVWLRLRQLRHARRSRARFAQVDWARTRAVSWGNFAQVRLNLAGREPCGIVRPSDRQQVVEEVKRVLLDLRHPVSGKPLFAAALTPDELYSGAHTDGAADVLGVPADWGVDASMHLFTPDAPLFVDRDDVPEIGAEMAEKVAGHSPNGLFFALGPPFRQGAVIGEANIWDVLPTVLHALGLKLPPGLDGQVVEDAFEPDFLASHPIRFSDRALQLEHSIFGPGYSREDLETLENRLRDLGYM